MRKNAMCDYRERIYAELLGGLALGVYRLPLLSFIFSFCEMFASVYSFGSRGALDGI